MNDYVSGLAGLAANSEGGRHKGQTCGKASQTSWGWHYLGTVGVWVRKKSGRVIAGSSSCMTKRHRGETKSKPCSGANGGQCGWVQGELVFRLKGAVNAPLQILSFQQRSWET